MKPGTTTYSIVLGETTPFNDSGKGRKLDEFGETSRDMVLATETKRPICWMDPTREITLAQIEASLKDESYDNNNYKCLRENLESAHVGGFHAVRRSGTSYLFSDTSAYRYFLGLLQGTMLERG